MKGDENHVADLFSKEELKLIKDQAGDSVSVSLGILDHQLNQLLVLSKNSPAHRRILYSILDCLFVKKQTQVLRKDLWATHKHEIHKSTFFRLIQNLDKMMLLKYKNGMISILNSEEWRRVYHFMQRYPLSK